MFSFIFAFSACGAIITAEGRYVNFRGAGETTADVQTTLDADLKDFAHRLPEFEEGLSHMFNVLPKNSNGKLDHMSVRYALHRFFLSRHNWFIRGLEPRPYFRPDNESQDEWIPNYLQQLMEAKFPSGLDVHGLAVMALSLEDLVRKETRTRVGQAYQAHDVLESKSVNKALAKDILKTYTMSFVMSNKWDVKHKSDLEWKRRMFKKRYQGVDELNEFADKLYQPYLEAKEFDVNAVAEAAGELGKAYSDFNIKDCTALRDTLKTMEGTQPGRVRLSTFYNMSLYTYWNFVEKVDYLRALGALDESGKFPAVIAPNYLIARPNCLSATNLYAVCCPNVCEEYTATIEKSIGHPQASAGRIAELVTSLPAMNGRLLSDSLRARLEEISTTNGGDVPLHGRLFAQWMHHVFPMDCPMPHQENLNPMTADEWLSASGGDAAATEEEMKQQILEDTCVADGSDCEESGELPWDSSESLILVGRHNASAGASRPKKKGGRTLLTLLGLIVGAALFAYSGSAHAQLHNPMEKQRLKVAAVAVNVGSLAHCVGILDGKVFLVAVLASAGIAIAGAVAKHRSKSLIPMVKKV